MRVGFTRARPLLPVVAAAIVAIVSSACETAPAPAQAQSQGPYLPLEVGHRWELRSSPAGSPMVLQVTARDGDGFIVQWTNPFVPNLRFRFALDGPRVKLTGLDMGTGLGPIPAEVVYFDFSRREGENWSNATGRFRVMEAGARVTTPSGTYENAIEIETTDRQGQSMYWTFAPGVGFVRWGRGSSAYLLTSFQSRTSQPPGGAASATSSAQTRTTQPLTDAPAAPGNLRILGWPRVAVDANPATNESGQQAFALVLGGGAGFVHLPPTWTEIEPQQGQYRWDAVDFRASVAYQNGLPINLNFRVVDTNHRSMPSAYASWAFDDQRLADRLIAALQALAPRTQGQVRWIAIGNEIDVYFGTRQSEIAAYAALVKRVLPTVRGLFRDAQFTVNFTYGGLGTIDRFREITDLADCISFTYYPLNPDFTMRSPAAILDDLPRMVAAANTKSVILQEVGYPSSERLNSSTAKQAEFVTNVFEALLRQKGRVVGATFLFLSDLPTSTVDELVKYYDQPNVENFRAYLATLGLRTQGGTPKPAWDAFVRGGQRLASEAQK
jgi:hypothetical protein